MAAEVAIHLAILTESSPLVLQQAAKKKMYPGSRRHFSHTGYPLTQAEAYLEHSLVGAASSVILVQLGFEL